MQGGLQVRLTASALGKRQYIYTCILGGRYLHCVQEHLFLVCELLRANLYEFQKYNRDNGDELYFTLPRLQKIAHQVCQALGACLPPHAAAVHSGAAANLLGVLWCSSSEASVVTCTRGPSTWCLPESCRAEIFMSAMLQVLCL